MRRVQIDFLSPVRRNEPGQVLLISLLVVAFIASAMYYRHILSETAALKARYRTENEAQSPARGAPAGTDKITVEMTRRWQSARAIVERLSIPWLGLFNALEEATTDEVTLLRVEPDPGHREVRITVQTPKLANAISYARHLMSSGALTSATIVSQRDMTSDRSGLIQVIVSAKWVNDSSSSSAANEINLSTDRPVVAARAR